MKDIFYKYEEKISCEAHIGIVNQSRKIWIQLKCCVLCVETQQGNLILKYFKFGFMMMNWLTVWQQ